MSKRKYRITVGIDPHIEEYLKNMEGGSIGDKIRRLIEDGIKFRDFFNGLRKNPNHLSKLRSL